MTDIVIVNASHVLTDAEAALIVPALQAWDDNMLAPAWGFGRCMYSFQNWLAWESAPVPNAWPIFLNRHSADDGVLGYHSNEIGPYGRVFVGDAIRYGISWTVDCSHEACELRGDPNINKTFTMADGRQAMFELADAVEDDSQAIDVGGVKLSNFVLPAYFAASGPGPYDFQKKLTGVCPTLTPGGYMSIYDGSAWTQATAMHLGGPPSWRSVRYHHSHRRMERALITP